MLRYGSAPRGGDSAAWQETEFHQPAGVFIGQIQAIEHAVLTLAQIHDGPLHLTALQQLSCI